MQPEAFFAGHPFGFEVYQKVRAAIETMGPVEVDTSKSQVAFRRDRGFAYLWMPGQYLRNPDAEVVLAIVLARRDGSARFKEVVHPTPRYWMHHLEIRHLTDVDDEVRAWLGEAASSAERARG